MRRIAIVGICASVLAAACSFPGVSFTDGGADGTMGQKESASPDATNGEGSVEVEAGAGDERTTVADAPEGDVGADVGADAGLDASNPADASAPKDAGKDVGSAPDAAADGPNCNCGAGSMLATNVACKSVLGIGCTGEGFMGSGPVCGAAAHYYTCVTSGLSCAPQDDGLRVQQCQ